MNPRKPAEPPAPRKDARRHRKSLLRRGFGPRLSRAPRLGPAAVLAAGVLAASPARAQAPEAPPDGNRADYRIEAVVEGAPGEPKRLTGSLELRWVNGSGEAVRDLWFHLYLNAFSNNRSTHMEEARGKIRGVELEQGWGWSRLTSLRVARVGNGGYHDVFPTFRYRRPDDGNESDRTVFSVDLPWELGDGEAVLVQLHWDAQLPRVRRRTGYKDDFLLVAQWFPKLGVYEADRGWNCHQFHANSEFYADYGTYDVTLHLPPRFGDKVFGSGVLEKNTREGDSRTVRFVAPSFADQRRVDATGRVPLVHDFTWTADPDYEIHQATFRPARWIERFPDEVERVREILGPDVVEMRNVDVTVLVQPEHSDQAERHREATEAALFFYGLWFGEYPYQHVTVVDPAWGARAAGGMEYPTLFTCGTRMFTTEDMHRPESVTVHEAGHQFWYGLVGNNEFEAAWLDEGLNSYTDSEVLWRVYGPRRSTTTYAGLPLDGVAVVALPERAAVQESLLASVLPVPGPVEEPLEPGFLEWWRDQPRLTFVPEWTDPRWRDRSRYLEAPASDPIETYAWRYVDRKSYVSNSYPRTAAALRSLPAVIGYGPFLRGMRHYAETWRYRHPYPEDFYRAFQEGAGVDVQWYFDDLFRGTGTVDWSVEVGQERRSRPRGFFQSEGGAFLEAPTPDDDHAEEPWRIDVTLRRQGELRLPLPVRLTFEDGSVRNLLWTREEQAASTWKRIEIESEAKLRSVLLDPDDGYYLDEDMSDNQWFEETDGLASWRWGERALALYQRWLHWMAGVGG